MYLKKPHLLNSRERELKPIVGTMTEESRQRKQSWLKHGCNAFDSKRPISLPISFWSEEDIWEYIKLNNIEYSKIYDMGYERSGCVYCGYGCQREKEGEGRFERMKITHPQLYKYVIENMKMGDVFKKVNELCGTNIKY
jgi:3'-phosphoadenosine 5'-phosphosulfate sulfotransferase (PAPS reductase)/FAD synthetase